MQKLIVLFLALGLFSSCKKNENHQDKNELDGVWYLKNVTCMCPPANFQGTHAWGFDTDNYNVQVTNSPDELLQILDAGTYPYSISATKITIDSVAYDYHFENNKLILSHKPEADGPYMEFERN